MSKVKEMTTGPALPLIFSFTMPLLLGNLLQQTYSLIDASIVGKFLGINALASVGASTSVIFLILGFCNGCCCGFGIPVAQKCYYCRDILRMMRTPDLIFDGAYDYLLVTFIGIPCTFFYNLLASIIRALGDSKTPFWFLLLSTILNVFLDLFCILVLGWGVMGAAIATVVSQGVSALLCYFYMIRKFPILRPESASDRKFHSGLARTLLAMGVPMGLQFSITAIGSIMLQSANNALGTTCVAAFTSAIRIKMFFICPFESLGIAMATYGGQNYGAGKPGRIWQGVKVSSAMMFSYALVVAAILLLFSRQLALLFVDPHETEILDKAALYLHVSCFFFPILGLLCILRYTIQGVGFSNFAMFSGIMEMIARTLVSLYAVSTWGYLAVCFGDPTAWIAADLFLVPAFWYVYKQIKKRNHEKDALSTM